MYLVRIIYDYQQYFFTKTDKQNESGHIILVENAQLTKNYEFNFRSPPGLISRFKNFENYLCWESRI